MISCSTFLISVTSETFISQCSTFFYFSISLGYYFGPSLLLRDESFVLIKFFDPVHLTSNSTKESLKPPLSLLMGNITTFNVIITCLVCACFHLAVRLPFFALFYENHKCNFDLSTWWHLINRELCELISVEVGLIGSDLCSDFAI